MKQIPKRIHIIGSVGSGKTTLAKQLSLKFDIPFYELDNVVWVRHKSGDIRRTEHEKEECLHTIIQSDSWIVEGVHSEEWVANSFLHADLIIFLDTKYSIRTYRIIMRFLKQKMRLEYANYKPTFQVFLNMFKWNKHFEEVGKPNFFTTYGMYNDKIIIFRNQKCSKNYVNSWHET
ncbi:DNA topology modulation protein FlaR [Pseudogracilibacillus auburnensis]|uniref:Adenylate kinase family enzyme n=1 Tax=Pseudogracilibacillus auburnensis TaxID=1494959 RepID=A0A2V3WC97_9BACI|nr:DNA topology modulation protein FlaR [Pseudogracilibacillus auburnensis]PXW90671.1 adenylate kinase family enzyme [Pseudogracilibacillus auburnensis]